MPPARPILPIHVCLPHLEKYPEGKPPDPSQVLLARFLGPRAPAKPPAESRARHRGCDGSAQLRFSASAQKKKKFEVWLRFCSSEETKINIINDYEQVGRNTSRG